MAHIVLIDPRFTFNAVDMASHVTQLELTLNTDQVLDVSGGDTVEMFLAGLRKYGGKIEGYQDFAVGVVDSVIYAAWLARTAVAITLGADKTAAKSTSNPSYEFTAFVADYSPYGGGGIGQAVKFSLTVAPTTDLTRATA